MKKIDTRSLTPAARDEIRKLVIRLRQQSGMDAAALAAIAGVHPGTVRKWLSRARKAGVGSLTEQPRGRPVGSCRKLTLAQELWMRETVIGQNPKQQRLPHALWTRRAIRELLRQEFGLEVSDRLVGKYLKRWGFTPQRPIQRALEQPPEQVQAWLRDTYPALVAKARAEGAVIYFGDETAVKEDTAWVRGFAPKGQTPILKQPQRWDQLSMISALSARGEVAFRIIDGGFTAERFMEFLTALIDTAPRKILLIVDHLRVHKAAAVTAWLEDKTDRIELAFLPLTPLNPTRTSP